MGELNWVREIMISKYLNDCVKSFNNSKHFNTSRNVTIYKLINLYQFTLLTFNVLYVVFIAFYFCCFMKTLCLIIQ
jgi:hypothetical protein